MRQKKLAPPLSRFEELSIVMRIARQYRLTCEELIRYSTRVLNGGDIPLNAALAIREIALALSEEK